MSLVFCLPSLSFFPLAQVRGKVFPPQQLLITRTCSPLLAKEAFTRNRKKLKCVLVCCELLNDLVNRFRNVILHPSMSTLLVRSSLYSLLISKTAKPIL